MALLQVVGLRIQRHVPADTGSDAMRAGQGGMVEDLAEVHGMLADRFYAAASRSRNQPCQRAPETRPEHAPAAPRTEGAPFQAPLDDTRKKPPTRYRPAGCANPLGDQGR